MSQRTTDGRTGMATGHRGFTVIEIIMVMVLIGLMLGYAIPKINVTKMKVDGAARLLRSMVMRAQRTSITRQSNTIISFDLANQRIRIVEDYNNNDTINTTDRVYFRRLPEGAKFLTPTMTRVSGATATGALQGSNLITVSSYPSVVFRRDGSASSDAELYITLRTGVATEFRAVTIDPGTGRTDMYRWGGSSWVRMTN